jgi:hypothetical protein
VKERKKMKKEGKGGIGRMDSPSNFNGLSNNVYTAS